LRDAKLLALVSISSLKALDTVNFNSLFFVPIFPFTADSFLSLLVALCSASLRLSKLFVIGGAEDFEKVLTLGVKEEVLLLNSSGFLF